jgi:hypothetical protein
MHILTRFLGFMERRKNFEAAVMATPTSGSVSNPHTFAGVDFGPEPGPGQRRYIAVAIAAAQSSNRAITGVTIGGVTATQITANGTTPTPRGVWVAEVPTGTSGSVVISFDGTIATVGAVVARLINPGNHLGVDTASALHSSGNVSLDLDVPSGGFAMAAVSTQNASTTTWTGLTELIDTDLNSGEFFTAAAGRTAGTPLVVLADNADNTPDNMAGTACSWGP